MDKVADLHIHTYYSDGIYSPEEIVEKSAEKGISAISITDHDTVDGLERARAHAEKQSIELINGIEMTAFEGIREYHILGYDFDPAYPPLKKHLEEYREARLQRAEKIWKKLSNLGVKFEFELIIEKAGVAPVTRPHIAAAIRDTGYVETLKEAFVKYIGDKCPADVQKTFYPVEKCIKLINDSGGMASLAHPALTVTQSILYKMIRHGLDGIEIVHPMHSESLRKYYNNTASQYWLLGTGGSDFHGNKEWDNNNFGNFVIPYSAVESLKIHTGKVVSER